MPWDEVDRLLAGWRQARPDLDLSPLEVLSRVARLGRHLERERAAVFASHALETWSFDVLSALRRADPPHELTPGQLVSQTLVTSGTMTHRVDLLEGRALVRRAADAADARSVRVRLTAAGRRLVDAAIADLAERERVLLAPLADADRRRLAGLLRRVLGPLDAG